ncbi:ABC transporter [Colletotrichum tofieldiae]|nr:ABC transporter [Colletotrichum tofieldiae]
MSTENSCVNILEALFASIAFILSCVAPLFSRLNAPNPKVAKYGCLAQAVIYFGQVLSLFHGTVSGSITPNFLSAFYPTCLFLSSILQLDRLYDDGSIWNLYLWSWVAGAFVEITVLCDTTNYSLLSEATFTVLKCSIFFHFILYNGIDQNRRLAHPKVPDSGPASSTSDPQEQGAFWPWMRKFRIFWKFVWPSNDRSFQCFFGLAIASSIVQRFLQLVEEWAFGRVVDDIRKPTPIFDKPLLLWLIIRVMSPCVDLLKKWTWAKVKVRRQQKLQTAVQEKIMNLDASYHDAVDPTDTIQAFADASGIEQVTDSAFLSILPKIIAAAFGLLAMCAMCGPFILLVLLACTTVYFIHIRGSVKAILAETKVVIAAANDQDRQRQDSIRGWRTAANHNRIHSETSSYFQKSAEKFSRISTYYDIHLHSDWLSETIVIIAQFMGILLIIGSRVGWNPTGGDLVAFLAYWKTIMAPLELFKQDAQGFGEKLHGADRLRQILERQPKLSKEGKKLEIQGGAIKFVNVTFSYGEKKVLDNINVEITAGSTVALVGPSGGGKSTLINLLMRHDNPDSGDILIDHQNLRYVDVSSLRDWVGILEQKSFLFNRTIMENLLYAKPGATTQQVHDACRNAAIHDAIMKLPLGYESSLGVDGNEMSGGEQQRLKLARCLLKQPKVLLLDEGTSALDTGTESFIKDNIERVFKDSTVLIVAHRLSSIMHADKIIYLGENGNVLEEGTHDSLLRKGEHYGRLWQLQIGG